MQYAGEKDRLFRLAVAQGWKEEDIYWSEETGVPSPLLKRWMRSFYAPVGPLESPSCPRLVNRYMIGADPEFAFLTEEGMYHHAEKIGMNTLLPFGCDMSGRQAELRAEPSRWGIEVLASMTDALRWIPIFYPEADKLKWCAKPVIGNDGCGGHWHMGRKRPHRDIEVRCLDSVTYALGQADVYDKEKMNERQRVTKFGRLGDIRLQTHGYEYRTAPTWLYSPLGAYIACVANKLAVLFETPLQYLKRKEVAKLQILNLFRYYRGLDDDARLALRAIEMHGFPVAHENDFKDNWGVLRNGKPRKINQHFFPISLQSESTTVLELFNHFNEGAKLPAREPKVSHIPFELKELYPVQVQVHHFDVPNLAQGLLSRKCTICVGMGYDSHIISGFQFPRHNEFKKKLSAIDLNFRLIHGKNAGSQLTISVAKQVCQNREKLNELRQLLSNPEFFPACKGERALNVDWTEWDKVVANIEKPAPEEPLHGLLLLNVQGTR